MTVNAVQQALKVLQVLPDVTGVQEFPAFKVHLDLRVLLDLQVKQVQKAVPDLRAMQGPQVTKVTMVTKV